MNIALLKNIYILSTISTVEHACKRCCRVHLNATCYPIEPYETHIDGTPCIQGICNKVEYIITKSETGTY